MSTTVVNGVINWLMENELSDKFYFSKKVDEPNSFDITFNIKIPLNPEMSESCLAREFAKQIQIALESTARVDYFKSKIESMQDFHKREVSELKKLEKYKNYYDLAMALNGNG